MQKLRAQYPELHRIFPLEYQLNGRDSVNTVVRSGSVAIKIFALDEESNFERELTIAQHFGLLNMPSSICIATSYMMFGTYNVLVMPLVCGLALTTCTGVTQEFCRQAFIGLAFLHQHGVVHGDLKPGNILVTRAGTPVIVDFDWARTKDECKELGPIPTYAYVSPDLYLAKAGFRIVDGVFVVPSLTDSFLPSVNRVLSTDNVNWNIYTKNDVWACSLTLLTSAINTHFTWMSDSRKKMQAYFTSLVRTQPTMLGTFHHMMNNILAQHGLEFNFTRRATADQLAEKLKA